MVKLKGLLSTNSGTLRLESLEAMFFPKAPKGGNGAPWASVTSSSSVTEKKYSHVVKILKKHDPGDYIQIFDCLAKYAKDQTPLSHFVDWVLLAKLAHGSGSLTNAILRHIMFWFEGYDLVQGSSKHSNYS